MQDVLIGILALVVGGLFCFRGFMTMRIVIAIWGAFTGFLLGAGIAQSFTDDGFLGSATAWILGLILALLFALIAYFYYEISVIIAMSAIGFAIGTSVMVAIGVTWSWVIITVGVLVGLVLAVTAILADLPTLILVVLTAFAGSSIVVFGLMLVFGVLDASDLDSAATTDRLEDDWWWYAIYLTLAIAGMITQLRTADQLSRSMRESWASEGGRDFRSS
jgi:predicted outer membrane lipoprotein